MGDSGLELHFNGQKASFRPIPFAHWLFMINAAGKHCVQQQVLIHDHDHLHFKWAVGPVYDNN